MKRLLLGFAIITSCLLCSCAASIPVTSNINDFVMLGVKTNTNEKVDFTYTSKVQNGKIKAYTKDMAEEVSGPGYEHTEASSMEKMVSEFMNNKFPNITENGTIKIQITFEDFHIEQFTEESTGKQVVTALFGGKSDMILVAKVKVKVFITRNGKEEAKIITGSSEDRYTSVTTRDGTYDKNDSIEIVHAKNINNANNKVLMLLNAYFQELAL